MSTPVYVFAQMQVIDYDDYFERYAKPFIAVIQQYSGEVLAATPKGTAWEGGHRGNWSVLVKFASEAEAQTFYDSPEYAPLKDLRLNELTTDAMAFMVPVDFPDFK